MTSIDIQRQPSRTSCGPTVVAMILGMDATAVVAALPSIRIKARRKKRTHGTNVGELARLLMARGYRLGRRLRGDLPRFGTAIVRCTRPGSTNWHWLLLRDGVVYDSANATSTAVDEFERRIESKRLSFYEVEDLVPTREAVAS